MIDPKDMKKGDIFTIGRNKTIRDRSHLEVVYECIAANDTAVIGKPVYAGYDHQMHDGKPQVFQIEEYDFDLMKVEIETTIFVKAI